MNPTSGTAAARRDIAADITARIIADLERGVLPWKKPWDGARSSCAGRCACQARPAVALDSRVRRVMIGAVAGAAWGAIELDLPRGYRGGARPRTTPDTSRPPGNEGASRASWGAGAGGRAQRLRGASGARHAVVKAIGYRKGRGEAGRTLDYVARRERIDMETSGGETLTTQENLRSLLDEWSTTFSERADGRDVMHLMLSFPADATPEKAGEIARAVLPEITSGGDWAFAVHADTGHAHVHALVRMCGPDGRQLRTTRVVLHRWREATARTARERGVALEASPRWARGRGERGERSWERAMRERGETPRRHRAAAARLTGGRVVVASMERVNSDSSIFRKRATGLHAPVRSLVRRQPKSRPMRPVSAK